MNRAQRYHAIYNPHKMRWAVTTGQGHTREFYKNLKRQVTDLPRLWEEAGYTDIAGKKVDKNVKDVVNKHMRDLGFKQLPNLPAKGVAVAALTNVVGLGMMIYGPMKFKVVGTALLAIPDVLIVPAVELIA